MAQIYMFREELGKAVKFSKCHSVNKQIFSSKDKKKVEKGWDRTGEKEKQKERRERKGGKDEIENERIWRSNMNQGKKEKKENENGIWKWQWKTRRGL